MEQASYDLAVIGSGPGGYVAAIRAAQLGLKTICIEKSASLGGTCLHVGCIPSKALLYTTEIFHFLKTQGQALGLESSQLTLQFDAMMSHKKKVIGELAKNVEGLLKKHRVTTRQGLAELTAPQTIVVKGDANQEIQAKNILLATGSEPIALPFLPFDEKQVVSSTGALALAKIPASLIVIGAGVIGVELASVYCRLGSKVILIEMLDHICTNLDATLHQHYLQTLTKQGLIFHLKSKVKTAEIKNKQVVLACEIEGKPIELTAECVLVAVGRRPFSKNLGLSTMGVQQSERGYVQVDENFRTNIPSIYAIGDLIEGPMLAHRASEEGLVVAELVAGHRASIDYMTIPNIIYTDPEIASVGFTEAEAIACGFKVVCGISSMKANPRARVTQHTEGLIKVIGDQNSGRLLGMHIMAPQASELIAEGVTAIHARMTLKQIALLPHGHPTYSEAIKEACSNVSQYNSSG